MSEDLMTSTGPFMSTPEVALQSAARLSSSMGLKFLVVPFYPAAGLHAGESSNKRSDGEGPSPGTGQYL